MEKVAELYATLGLSKEQILQALREAEVRFEDDIDMWSDFWNIIYINSSNLDSI